MSKKIKIVMTFTSYYDPDPDMTLEDWRASALDDYYITIDQITEDPEVTVSLVNTTKYYPEG